MSLPTRDLLRATTPSSYRWAKHVALIVAFAASGIALCLYVLGGLRAGDVGFVGVACVLLLLERSLTEAFWVNVDDPGAPMSGFIEYTRLDPLPELGGRSLVYVPYYVPTDHPTYREDDDKLLERTLAGLERVVRGFRRSDLVDWRVFRDPWAQLCEREGFAVGQLKKFSPEIIDPHGRIHFVGSYADNLNWGMEAATRSANRVAQQLDQA